ncbi:CaiB/BaiF CoA-transferase family protein [Saccharopolyspora taberi]|uniref:CoA transferase n=1 Tax=Saccharopolyspora taberi TaxID=60895 RepID=A0ABN3VB80_9PSEU
MRDDSTRFPLEGVRVLELGNYIAAPTAGRMLADFGAEVVKVERPGTGDELRNWRLYAGSVSMLFHTINRNKKSVVLDLKTDRGRAVVLDLVRHCDVVIENFRPGTLERWGLGPEALESANPDVVLARISGFGQTGPLADRPGFAAVAEAMGGLRDLVGEADRPPSRVGVSIGDSIAGLHAAFGIVVSLLQRATMRNADQPRPPLTDRIVDIALYEAVFSMMESLVPDYLAHGVRRRRVGGRMEGIAPTNAYACRDGSSVVIAGNGDSIFRRYMQAIGRPDLADDPRLQTNAGRWARRDELDGAIEEWTSARTRADVLEALESAGVPAGPIYTAADICADQQYQARGMIQQLAVDTGAGQPVEVGFPGVVPVIGPTSLPLRSPGPALGEHTDEVLGSLLGMSPDQIEEARK